MTRKFIIFKEILQISFTAKPILQQLRLNYNILITSIFFCGGIVTRLLKIVLI